MKTRKRNNKKIRKTKHKKKRKTMRIKVIKKKYNKTRKMKGGQTISQQKREKLREKIREKIKEKNRKRTLRARRQAIENKKKIVILNNELVKLQRKVDAKNTILTIIKRQRERKIEEINKLKDKIDDLKNELIESGNKEKFCQDLIKKIQNLKIIKGDETTELADGMLQIMKTGQIIIPHETNKEDQKDVWIKLDFGEQSLKSTPSAMENNIQTNHTIYSLRDMLDLDFSNKTTVKGASFIKNLIEDLRDNKTDSMRGEEQKNIDNIKAQIENFEENASTKNSRPASAPAAPVRQSATALPAAPIKAWNKKSDK